MQKCGTCYQRTEEHRWRLLKPVIVNRCGLDGEIVDLDADCSCNGLLLELAIGQLQAIREERALAEKGAD